MFLAFTENQEVIKARIKAITDSTEPYGDVTCDDGVRHVLWKVSIEDSNFFQSEFEKMDATYVADGHHRTAAAFNVGMMRRSKAIEEGRQLTGEESLNFFMALHFPADNLLIMDYNRVIKDLNGMAPEEFLEKLSEHFEIEPIAEGQDTRPGGLHKMSLLINKKWFRLTVKEDKVDTSSPST